MDSTPQAKNFNSSRNGTVAGKTSAQEPLTEDVLGEHNVLSAHVKGDVSLPPVRDAAKFCTQDPSPQEKNEPELPHTGDTSAFQIQEWLRRNDDPWSIVNRRVTKDNDEKS